MCGIVGFISKEKNQNLIEKFVNDISHRGPDSSNYSIINVGNNYLHLGSARFLYAVILERICQWLQSPIMKSYTMVKFLI